LAGENEIQALVAACTRELHENLRMMPGYNAVVKANRSAYAQWRRDQASTHPGLLKLLGKSNSVSAACERLTDRHDQLVSMLSSLPCIPIVFKYTQSELLRDIGRDVYVQGRVHLLRLLATNTSTPPPARRLSIEWASGIQAIPSLERRWTLAHNTARENRVVAAMGTVPMPGANISELDAADWTMLLGYLRMLVAAEHPASAVLSTGRVAASLMVMTAAPEWATRTRAAAKRFKCGEWTAAQNLARRLDWSRFEFPPEVPQGTEGGPLQY
jgi:hypothetical protein